MRTDLYEGLNQAQKDTLFRACELFKWASTYYSHASHSNDLSDLAKLSILGAYAECFKTQMDLFVEMLAISKPGAEPIAALDEIDQYIAKRGWHMGLPYRRTSGGKVEKVTATTMCDDILVSWQKCVEIVRGKKESEE